MNCADVHLLPQRADAADLVMPSKLTGMLATGRPVIAGAAAGTQIAVVVDGHGVVVPPGDSGSIAAAVIELSHDMPRCQQLGAAARQYAVAHLSRPSILYRFEHDLAELLGLPAPAAQQPSVDDLAAAEAETHLAPHFSGTATESHGRPLSTRR
jgi:colanic acid biosynthesis glycosyl transferase WcaI